MVQFIDGGANARHQYGGQLLQNSFNREDHNDILRKAVSDWDTRRRTNEEEALQLQARQVLEQIQAADLHGEAATAALNAELQKNPNLVKYLPTAAPDLSAEEKMKRKKAEAGLGFWENPEQYGEIAGKGARYEAATGQELPGVRAEAEYDFQRNTIGMTAEDILNKEKYGVGGAGLSPRDLEVQQIEERRIKESRDWDMKFTAYKESLVRGRPDMTLQSQLTKDLAKAQQDREKAARDLQTAATPDDVKYFTRVFQQEDARIKGMQEVMSGRAVPTGTFHPVTHEPMYKQVTTGILFMFGPTPDGSSVEPIPLNENTLRSLVPEQKRRENSRWEGMGKEMGPTVPFSLRGPIENVNEVGGHYDRQYAESLYGGDRYKNVADFISRGQ